MSHQGSWEKVAGPCAFSIRDTAEPFVWKGKMWMSNGYEQGDKLIRDLWNSSDGVTWAKVLDQTPYDGYAEIAIYRDKLWAVKGSVWTSDDGVNWTRVAAATPFGARGYGQLLVFKDRLWQLGSGKDIWCTQDGVSWECVQPEAPYGPRYGSAVMLYQDQLWLMGGATAQPSDPPEQCYPKYTTHHDVWRSADGVNWSRLIEHAPWAPRMWTVPALYAGRLWIIGGFSNRERINFADAWHTADGLKWEVCVSEPMFSPRHQVSPFVYQNSLWVVAGNSWPLTNDVWRLTLPGT